MWKEDLSGKLTSEKVFFVSLGGFLGCRAE